MVMALTIAVLVAGSVYLVLQRGMVRIVFGMSLFGHATNLTLLAGGVLLSLLKTRDKASST